LPTEKKFIELYRENGEVTEALVREKNVIVKELLCKTDWLIDQIVYMLYGLAEDEIKIIEVCHEDCRAD